MNIYVWADGTWCEKEDLEEYLTMMSDDFYKVYVNIDDAEDIEKEVAKYIEEF